jgi:predicted dehydrogenase
VSNHIPRIKADPRARLAGVCRLGAVELRKVKAHFGFDYATEDFLKMLDEVPMEGLVISTTHRLHAVQNLSHSPSTVLGVSCKQTFFGFMVTVFA